MMGDNVMPMLHVCRKCTPSDECSGCEWLAKLLRQEITLDKIAETRVKEE